MTFFYDAIDDNRLTSLTKISCFEPIFAKGSKTVTLNSVLSMERPGPQSTSDRCIVLLGMPMSTNLYSAAGGPLIDNCCRLFLTKSVVR